MGVGLVTSYGASPAACSRPGSKAPLAAVLDLPRAMLLAVPNMFLREPVLGGLVLDGPVLGEPVVDELRLKKRVNDGHHV